MATLIAVYNSDGCVAVSGAVMPSAMTLPARPVIATAFVAVAITE